MLFISGKLQRRESYRSMINHLSYMITRIAKLLGKSSQNHPAEVAVRRVV